MGYNLISACHKCKEQVGHLRGKENETILPFYKRHKDCARVDIANVQTVMDNNGNEPDWTCEYKDVFDELEKRWAGGSVKCMICNHIWIAVYPDGIPKIECPNCGNMVSFISK